MTRNVSLETKNRFQFAEHPWISTLVLGPLLIINVILVAILRAILGLDGNGVVFLNVLMFFVFFPIAAIWLDPSGQVMDAQLARPFRPLYVPRVSARDVLEGPPSLLEQVQIGDTLRFGE